MEKKIIYQFDSLYRDTFRVTGFEFGTGKKSVCIIGNTRGNEYQQIYTCAKLVQKLKQLEEAWKSYFTLLKTKGVEHPKPPRFKKESMDITFLKDAIQVTEAYIRLSIPKQLKLYLQTLNVNADYLYLKTQRLSNIRIKEIQLKLDGKKCTMMVVYDDCIAYKMQ